MEQEKKSKLSLRARADKIKDFRCKNLIAVIENPDIANKNEVLRRYSPVLTYTYRLRSSCLLLASF